MRNPSKDAIGTPMSAKAIYQVIELTDIEEEATLEEEDEFVNERFWDRWLT